MKRYIKAGTSRFLLGSLLKDGDTPRKLPKGYYYQIEKWGRDGRIANYGRLNYADTLAMLRGFKYKELVPGDGMWVKGTCTYNVEISDDI